MKNIHSKITLSAGFVLAMVFTFSCSGDDGDEGGGGSCGMSGYKKVEMPDGKIWMAENLNCNVSGSVCYNNDPANCAKYGRLYNWEAAEKACSGGWHLPSSAEWKALLTAVGGSATKLRAASPLWDGTDDFDFSALPGGFGYLGGSFHDVGSKGYWWYSRENNNGPDIYYWYMGGTSFVNGNPSFSVRCVQD